MWLISSVHLSDLNHGSREFTDMCLSKADVSGVQNQIDLGIF
uniref:Uncharacterized protein n=2 Tax=Chromobacterium violaceum TaxID=536 RepID=A0A2R4K2Q1_CHRVL|nr:hypothetical protein [Chromobacterium violaceum]